jgi:ABC-type antimicrobial peptide transport system permease subunit
MLHFLRRRLTVAILVALTVLTLSFLLTRLSGDLAISIAGPNATQEDIELIRRAYGLDRPLWVQYFDWLWRALQGDFGDSYFFKTRVARLIMERMPITMSLGLCGLAIALCVALPLGMGPGCGTVVVAAAGWAGLSHGLPRGRRNQRWPVDVRCAIAPQSAPATPPEPRYERARIAKA